MIQIKKIAAAVASAALVAFQATPAFAAVNITISGNGSGSTNTTDVDKTLEVTLVQTNDSTVTNSIDVEAETGDNDANDNTGGSVDIDTGDATATNSVTNTVNTNVAEIGCDCLGDITVTESGNGTGSTNLADIDSANTYTVDQFNTALVTNTVFMDSVTGENDAEDNTGGNVDITTGNASSNSDIINDLNSNLAMLGASGLDGMILVDISLNGSDSNNDALFTLANTIDLDQVNTATLTNELDLESESGDNDANDNTGGDVSVDTGDVSVGALVDNAINFNSAEADCCSYDLTGAISGNGTDSDSTIDYDDTNSITADQFNTDTTTNELDELEVDSGDNDANDNTDGDVEVTTGDATVDVEVINESNVNDLLTL